MSNQIELRHIKYFQAVASELHFRKAAEKLFISQPGLSRQIQQMEMELGTPLFVRSMRKVSLTPAGEYLLQELNLVTQNLSDIWRHCSLIGEGSAGEIKVGFVGSAMQNIIPEMMVRFKADHPTIRFRLNEMSNNQQIENLMSNVIDVGFVRVEHVPKELAIQPVFEDTFSVVLPEGHDIDQGNFSGLDQLKNEPFILFEKEYSQTHYHNVMELFTEANFTPVVTHSTIHAPTIFKLVENGFGISIVPTSLLSGYGMKIKSIELSDLPQRTLLSLVWNKSNRNPALRHFLSTHSSD